MVQHRRPRLPSPSKDRYCVWEHGESSLGILRDSPCLSRKENAAYVMCSTVFARRGRRPIAAQHFAGHKPTYTPHAATNVRMRRHRARQRSCHRPRATPSFPLRAPTITCAPERRDFDSRRQISAMHTATPQLPLRISCSPIVIELHLHAATRHGLRRHHGPTQRGELPCTAATVRICICPPARNLS